MYENGKMSSTYCINPPNLQKMVNWADKLDPLKLSRLPNLPPLTCGLRRVGVGWARRPKALSYFFFSNTWTKSNMILRVFQFFLPLPKQFQRLPPSQNNTFQSLFLVSLNSHSHSSASPIHHGGFFWRLTPAAERE